MSDGFDAGPVEIVLELSRLDEEVISDVVFHLLLGDEVIVASLGLVCPRGSAGVGNTAAEAVRVAVDQFVVDSILHCSEDYHRPRVVNRLHIDQLVREDRLIRHSY